MGNGSSKSLRIGKITGRFKSSRQVDATVGLSSIPQDLDNGTINAPIAADNATTNTTVPLPADTVPQTGTNGTTTAAHNAITTNVPVTAPSNATANRVVSNNTSASVPNASDSKSLVPSASSGNGTVPSASSGSAVVPSSSNDAAAVPSPSNGSAVVPSKSSNDTKTSNHTGTKSTNSSEVRDHEQITVRLCALKDLPVGKAVQHKVSSYGEVLLYRRAVTDEVTAVSTKCTHYNAPLIKGAQSGPHIRCPWHGACFSLITGDIEEFPGLDSLNTYKVEVSAEDVYLVTTRHQLKTPRRVRSMCRLQQQQAPPSLPTLHSVQGGTGPNRGLNSVRDQLYLIVGGGPASVSCVETLRQNGYPGRCLLLTNESHLPYDKPKLSKCLDIPVANITLRSREFYDTHDIEVQLDTEVVSVDPGSSSITVSRGVTGGGGQREVIKYNKLMIATGGRPRQLEDIPGHHLDNIHYLRTPEDAQNILKQAAGSRVVVIGTSFIGMEVASYLSDKCTEIHIIGHTSLPYERVLGHYIGATIMRLCQSKGVRFHNNCQVTAFKGHSAAADSNKLRSVQLSNGTSVLADVCVVGAGVLPRTEILDGTGIRLNHRRQVIVDKCMRTNVANIYACGDIVTFPLYLYGDKHVNVQHWQMALQHGRIAGLNMCTTVSSSHSSTQIHSVPYFWTVLYGKSIRYCGYSEGCDDIITHPASSSLTHRQHDDNTASTAAAAASTRQPDDINFVAYYMKGERVCAVASLGRDPVTSQAAQLMSQGHFITKDEARDECLPWLSKLRNDASTDSIPTLTLHH